MYPWMMSWAVPALPQVYLIDFTTLLYLFYDEMLLVPFSHVPMDDVMGSTGTTTGATKWFLLILFLILLMLFLTRLP